MKFAAIALRNLSRNLRRTLLSLLVISAGTIGILLTAGFIRFSFDGLREAIIHGGLGHIEVATEVAAAGKESAPERSISDGLQDWQAVRAEIEKTPHVLAAGGNIHLMGIVSKGERSASFLGVAVEPDRERRMGFEVKIRAGSPLPETAPAEGEDSVVLGLGLAESVGAKPGDTVTVLAMTADQTLNALDMKVGGLVTSGVQDLDTRLLKMHLASAQRLIGTDRVSDVVVTLDESSRTAAVMAALEARLAPFGKFRLSDWRARTPFYNQVRSLYAGIFWFLGSIIFVLVVLSTSNTLLMSVMERIREIGTLLALGTSRGQVAAIVLLEALWLGLLGGIAGDILGLAAIAAINAANIKMPPPPGAVSGIDLKLAIVPEAIAGVIVLMLVIMALAAVFPTLRAVRLRIVDALGHV